MLAQPPRQPRWLHGWTEPCTASPARASRRPADPPNLFPVRMGLLAAVGRPFARRLGAARTASPSFSSVFHHRGGGLSLNPNVVAVSHRALSSAGGRELPAAAGRRQEGGASAGGRVPLRAVLAQLLEEQPSISLREVKAALEKDHPELAELHGSKDVRLALRDLRAAPPAPAGAAGGGGGAEGWSTEPWGDPEAQRKDAAAGFLVSKDFAPFSQKDDIFCRSFWDKTVRTKRSEKFWQGFAPLGGGGEPWSGRAEGSGFTHADYALRNAAWHVMDTIAELKESEDRREGFLDPFTVLNPGPPQARIDFGSAEDSAFMIKKVATMLGADGVGVTGRDERWHYTSHFSRAQMAEKPNHDVPATLPHAIIVVTAMDESLLQTVPSALSEAAAGLGYGWDTVVLLSLAQFLRNAGYQAVASLNDTALAIPYAVQAGEPPRPPDIAGIWVAFFSRCQRYRC